VGAEGDFLIPRWDSGPKSRRCGTNRVQGPSGSFNTSPRRELPDGDIRNRARQTASGVPRKIAASEKLNDERGVKPLRVSRVRDDAEPGNCGRPGKGELLYSIP
jgi:hypothetical protein